MSLPDTLMLLFFVAVASYAQTVTGFAFGLILMGSVALLNIAPIPMVAILISLLSLFNCLTALYRNTGNLNWEIILLCSISGFVTLILGVWALNVLSVSYVALLKMILGAAIIVSSLLLIVRPAPQRYRSGKASFLFFGGLSGFMGGMFSTSGPPLVFHFYRQPLAQTMIRDTLLAIFTINSVQRLAVVGYQGAIDTAVLLVAATAVPVVLIFTWLGKRFPPPLSDEAMRRVAFVLLLLSGLSLCLSAYLDGRG